jgi:hypothetical protein
MTMKDKSSAAPEPPVNRLPLYEDVYGRILSVIMLLLGLRQWAVIVGVIAGGGGMFEAMSTPWQLATIHMAVIDLVAAVGLWMRVSWGNVLWIYAALSEVALHTAFIRTFGSDITLVAFHALTVLGFAVLTVVSRRERARLGY